MHRPTRLSVCPSALKAAEQAQHNQWESFETRKVAHMRLQELAKDRDIDQVLCDFIKREHDNFSSFSYATELSSEIEAMQRRINDLQVCPGFSMVLLSQLVLSGQDGFFLSPVSSSQSCSQSPAHSLPHGWDEGNAKRQPEVELQETGHCVLRAKSVSMLPPCTQQKHCSAQEGQELPGPPVGLAGVRNAASWGPSPALLPWGQWSPEGSSGMSLSSGGGMVPSLCWVCVVGDHCPPPCACVYTERNYPHHGGEGACREQERSPEGVGGTAARVSLCESGRALCVPASVLGFWSCDRCSAQRLQRCGQRRAPRGLWQPRLPVHAERMAAGLLPALLLQHLGPRLWHGELGTPS